MRAFYRLFAASVALASLPFPPAAIAASRVTGNTTGQASVLKSLSVIKKQDLDFGKLIVTGSGTVVIDPVSGATTKTGAITPFGTSAHPAVFTATGSRNSVVHIRLPQNPVTLTRVGGGGTMSVSTWTLDGSTNRRIPLNQAFDFAVGGTLTVAAGQADGTYIGTFTITVQYP